jgi:hypothetical protein
MDYFYSVYNVFLSWIFLFHFVQFLSNLWEIDIGQLMEKYLAYTDQSKPYVGT